MTSLAVRALERSYETGAAGSGGAFALGSLDFEVGDGRVAALLGPSGCGKTTLLRLIAGLDAPDRGDIRLGGESVLALPPHRRGVGLVFQELALFPHLDAATNVDFGLRMARWPEGRRRERVGELLGLFELDGLGRRRIDELSGGERQRVALARAGAPWARSTRGSRSSCARSCARCSAGWERRRCWSRTICATPSRWRTTCW